MQKILKIALLLTLISCNKDSVAPNNPQTAAPSNVAALSVKIMVYPLKTLYGTVSFTSAYNADYSLAKMPTSYLGNIRDTAFTYNSVPSHGSIQSVYNNITGTDSIITEFYINGVLKSKQNFTETSYSW